MNNDELKEQLALANEAIAALAIRNRVLEGRIQELMAMLDASDEAVNRAWEYLASSVEPHLRKN